MCKTLVKRVQSICRAYFRRKHTRGKSVERAELSCRTCFGKMNGILSPREWVDIARGAGVRAIAIMDFQEATGFQETAQAAEELRGEAESEELDFKMLYGMETVLENGCPVHLLVRSQEGLAQLYRLLESSWQGREERPFLRKAEIGGHRTGLLVGCPGEGGEVWRGILDNLDDARLEEIAGFYDYLSVLPPQNQNDRLPSTRKHALRGEALSAEELILKTIAIGKRLGKPVAAAGNVRTASQDWGMFKSSVAYGIQKGEGGDLDAPLPDLLYTEELLDAFSFLGKEPAEEIVIHVPNRLADFCEEIRIVPEDKRCLQPILPGAFQTVADLCREQLQMRYGGTIPRSDRERMEYELAVLQNNELLSSALLISRCLVQGLRRKGYLIRTIAHDLFSVYACPYVAYLLGVTEVDPLAIRIPFETRSECDAPDLELILSVSEECWEAVMEIFSRIFPQGTAVSYGDGAGWDKKPSRSHRRFFVPDAAQMRNWIPLKKADEGYRIPYGLVEDFPDQFRLLLWPRRT